MTPNNDDLEREFERLLRNPLTRRLILKRGAAGVMSASALAYLAACGTDEPSGGDKKAAEAKAIPKGKIADSMYMANWPLYIEEDHGTLKDFEKEYGTKIKYVEEVNDNTEFFGKVRQQYDQGNSGGRDIHVVTDWMAARMIRLGYVQKFDKSTMPTADANLIERLKSPPFDPKREFSMPWQSGLTGIIYRKDLVKREPRLTSRNDVNQSALKDPLLTFIAEKVLPITTTRPGVAVYPQVSQAIQEATEQVATGKADAARAAKDYAAKLGKVVGADKVSSD